MKKIFIVLAFLLLIFSSNLFAGNGIEIQRPVIRLAPPGMLVTAMFFKIINHSDIDLKLVKVTGDFAGSFELHSMDMVEGKMKMRPVESILLKKNSSTELKSGGLHIMIFDLKKSLTEGEIHKLKFVLDNKEEIEINAKVEKIR